MAEVPTYITSPVVVDDEGMQQDAFDYIRERWPEWVPSDGNLETWKIGAFARMTSEVADLNQDVPPGIFKYLGQSIHGIPGIEAKSASVFSTWTLIDNPTGRTIEAGTLVAIDGPDGDPIAFEVVNDVFVAAPDLTTAAGAVQLRSVDPGIDTNNLGGVGVQVVPLDPITWVDIVTLVGVTAGGADEETDSAYLDRLSGRMTLLTGRPILPRDYEVLVRDLAAQEGFDVRALGLDGYNPDDATFDNERFVTTVVMDRITGADLDPTLKTLLDQELQDLRELNFESRVIDPDRTVVDVTFTIVPAPSADGIAAAAAAAAAVTNYLLPQNWGLPTGADAIGWVAQDTLRRQEVSTIINNTEGVDHWETLTIGLNGGAQTTDEEFALAGIAAVTEPGVIDGSVAP